MRHFIDAFHRDMSQRHFIEALKRHFIDPRPIIAASGRTAALASQSAGRPHHICYAVHCVSGNASKTEVAPFLQDILVFRREDEQRGKCPE